jgi:hypothetical protein
MEGDLRGVLFEESGCQFLKETTKTSSKNLETFQHNPTSPIFGLRQLADAGLLVGAYSPRFWPTQRSSGYAIVFVHAQSCVHKKIYSFALAPFCGGNSTFLPQKHAVAAFFVSCPSGSPPLILL